MGCHFLLQGIFLTQGSNPHLQGHLLHWQAHSLPLIYLGSPLIRRVFFKRCLWSFLPVILWKHFTFPPLSTVGILGNCLEYRFFNYLLIFRNKNPEDNCCEITGEYDQNTFHLIMCFSLHLDSLKSNI